MWKWCSLLLPVLLLAADQGWKDKRAAEWTDDEANEVVTDSPWAQVVQPTIERPSSGRGGGMGRGGMGGGMGGRGGMGRGGMGMPGGTIGMPGGTIGMPGGQGGSRGPDGDRREPSGPRMVTIRWESALPVQEAHLRLKDTDTPTMDEGRYAVVLAWVPSRLTADAKPKAELKRQGQKTIKATETKIIPQDQGNLVVFYFSREKEITAKDAHIDFEAEVGKMKVKTTFDLAKMMYNGKLEL